ncbi:hypothetical protein ABFS82_03G072800 [Erythranthe guttata]|uniref:SGNH hydrolase-type esterase domain-containing protein n=1 Tax=Erythranthe guttata TaxID=4155 RepID=A0A022REH5_ERYGU|nr:hypothetical protein MIMGU_mgv1a009038mg [Erythranthe guttata]
MKFLCSLFTVFLPILFLSCNITRAVVNLHKNATFPALFIFGDSIFDTGNNNYIKTIAKANFPPYGKDFIGGIPTGRFSDGKIPSDLSAEELGIKTILPPFLDPSLQDQDLLTGVSFASASTGYDPLTARLSSVLSFSDQLELFKEYISKLNKIAGDEKSSAILRESLFLVDGGNNDFLITYFGTLLRKFQYDVPSYIDLLVSHASTFVQELYGLGARKIGVFGLPPIGCVPVSRTLRGGLKRKCAKEYNEAAQLFNNKLSAEIASLKSAQLSEAIIVYADIYNPTLDIIRNPQKYGFEIVDKGCCGTGTVELSFLCKYACSDVSDYVFWDSVHPTEKTYRIIVHRIFEEYISYFI